MTNKYKNVFHLINIKEMNIKVPMKCNFVTYQSTEGFSNENIHAKLGCDGVGAFTLCW